MTLVWFSKEVRAFEMKQGSVVGDDVCSICVGDCVCARGWRVSDIYGVFPPFA